MCDIITPILLAAGTAVSVVGSIVAGQQQADAARLKAQMDSTSYLNKATQEKQQANLEQIAGQYQARRQQEAADRLTAEQRTAFAAQGLQIDTGSPLDVQIDSKRTAALDEGLTIWNADQKARAFRGDAAIAQGNASLSLITGKIAADNAITNSYFNAGSSLLSGAGKIGGTSFGKNLFA